MKRNFSIINRLILPILFLSSFVFNAAAQSSLLREKAVVEASGDRWFYMLDMSDARRVQGQIFSRAITLEQGYDKIITAWHRVTPAD